MSLVLDVDGSSRPIDAPDEASLLFVLRNDLGKNGPKLGCGAAQCGACTVLADGTPIRSCVTPVRAAVGLKIETLDGLTGGAGELTPVQRAFLAEQAAQCGYCTAGLIMAATALLRNEPRPGEQRVREALDGHLCRCGTQNRVVRAVLRAARTTA